MSTTMQERPGQQSPTLEVYLNSWGVKTLRQACVPAPIPQPRPVSPSPQLSPTEILKPAASDQPEEQQALLQQDSFLVDIPNPLEPIGISTDAARDFLARITLINPEARDPSGSELEASRLTDDTADIAHSYEARQATIEPTTRPVQDLTIGISTETGIIQGKTDSSQESSHFDPFIKRGQAYLGVRPKDAPVIGRLGNPTRPTTSKELLPYGPLTVKPRVERPLKLTEAPMEDLPNLFELPEIGKSPYPWRRRTTEPLISVLHSPLEDLDLPTPSPLQLFNRLALERLGDERAIPEYPTSEGTEPRLAKVSVPPHSRRHAKPLDTTVIVEPSPDDILRYPVLAEYPPTRARLAQRTGEIALSYTGPAVAMSFESTTETPITEEASVPITGIVVDSEATSTIPAGLQPAEVVAPEPIGGPDWTERFEAEQQTGAGVSETAAVDKLDRQPLAAPAGRHALRSTVRRPAIASGSTGQGSSSTPSRTHLEEEHQNTAKPETETSLRSELDQVRTQLGHLAARGLRAFRKRFLKP